MFDIAGFQGNRTIDKGRLTMEVDHARTGGTVLPYDHPVPADVQCGVPGQAAEPPGPPASVSCGSSPSASLLRLLGSGNLFSFEGMGYSWSWAVGGILFVPVLLMILFRQKYPRWWFDWNVT